MKNRFYYDRSTVYGWCVYDRNTNTPAYDACAELLPPLRHDETGTYTVSPICETEFMAMRVCTRLNNAYRRSIEWDEHLRYMQDNQ